MLLKVRIIAIFLCLLGFQAAAGELVLSGVYKGQNLYIQNPLDGSEFCIKEIFINEVPVKEIPASTAFDLNLSFLKENREVTVRIVHGDNCRPRILNPNAIRPENDFQFSDFKVEGDRIIWTARGEKKYSKYNILKLEFNNWVVEQIVDCKAKPGTSIYEILIMHTSGVNKYKIKYIDVTGKISQTPEINYTSTLAPATFTPKRVSSFITFSREVKYDILDAYGKVVKSGTGMKVDCSDLNLGVYYITFDNQTDKFLKK